MVNYKKKYYGFVGALGGAVTIGTIWEIIRATLDLSARQYGWITPLAWITGALIGGIIGRMSAD